MSRWKTQTMKSYTIRFLFFFSCVVALAVFQLPGLMSHGVEANSSASRQDGGKTASPDAPLATFQCFGSQTLTQAGSGTFNRPSTTFTDSTGCNNVPGGLAGFGAGDRYKRLRS